MRRSLLALIPALLLACSTFGSDDNGGSGPGGGGGGGADEDAGQKPIDGTDADEALFLTALPKTPFFVIQGASVSIPLTISRGRNVADPITVTVEGLPTGVAPALLQFGVGESKAQLSVQAAGDAAQGAIHAKVRVTSGKSTAVAPVELFVRGAPGTLDTTFGDGGSATKLAGADMGQQTVELRLLPDDRIIVVGVCGTLSLNTACLVRLSADGKLDSSYGVSGLATVPGLSSPSNAALLPTGKLVVMA